MKCPHCLIEIHPNTKRVELVNDINKGWYVEVTICPSCSRNSYQLINYLPKRHPSGAYTEDVLSTTLFYPKTSNRNPVPQEVPIEYSKDYIEACLVLSDSPMA
ncbi:MAG: hypothetical protein V1855_02470, partial [bacterium]